MTTMVSVRGTSLRVLVIACVPAGAPLAAHPQPPENVVDRNVEDAVLPPERFEPERLREYLLAAPDHQAASWSGEAERVARALERHVREFLAGFPFRSFHLTLGISGHETLFGHPDEMFYALSIAVPYLSDETAAKTRAFLRAELARSAPYAPEGFAHGDGQPRESYLVPEGFRAGGRGAAVNAFGVFAFWAFSHYAGGAGETAAHWPRVRERMEPVLRAEYRFDTAARHERDEAERFTGDLAGVIGCLRLARLAADPDTEMRALERALEMLALRVDLERTNPRFLEVSKVSASHSLHMGKLARYLDLSPCAGKALAELTGGVAAARLAEFRAARNAWHLAFGPRLIGGENYTSPPHFSRALFDAAVFIETLPADQVLRFVDIPWCPGDYYFMSKCAYALWTEGGRRWRSLE